MTRIDINQSPSTNEVIVIAAEFSGLDPAGTLDVVDTIGADDHGAQGNYWHSGPMTTTNPHDLIVGFAWTADGASAPGANRAPWTLAKDYVGTVTGATMVYHAFSELVSSVAPNYSAEPKGTNIQTFVMAAAYRYTPPPSAVRCQPLTVQHNKVLTNLSSYPMTVNHTDPNLKHVTQGGFVMSYEGDDITFSSNSTGTALLKWDRLEYYDNTTGQLVTHVQVPAVNTSTDSQIYVCAGDSTKVTFQGGSTGAAWPSSHKGVYHFATTVDTVPGQLSYADSSQFGNHLAAVGIPIYAAGKIAGGISGLSPGTYANDLSFPALSGSATVTAWVKFITNGLAFNPIFWANTASYQYLAGDASGNASITWGYGSVSPGYCVSSTKIMDNNWHHVAFVYDSGGNNLSVYADGIQVCSAAQSGTPNPVASFDIGHAPGGGLNGTIDEVRIINAAVSGNEIRTYYNNESSPGTFYSLGSWANATGTAPNHGNGGLLILQ
jgi:hypothetical protein